MALLWDRFLAELLVVAIVLFLTIYIYFVKVYKYWKSKGIPTLPATIPFGHLGPVLSGKVSIGALIQNLYNHVGKTNKFSGFYTFTTPNLMVSDPEQIKIILVRDFKYFQDRVMYYNKKDDPISANLFSIEGQKWRDLRVKMTPTFTSGKLKVMFPTVLKLATQLNSFLARGGNIDMKDACARYTTDVIGSSAFGIECNTLKYPDAEFRKVSATLLKRSYVHNLMLMLATTYSKIGRLLRFKPYKSEVSQFFVNTIRDTIKYREDREIRRKDFMDLMIQLKNNGRLDDDVSGTSKLTNWKITEDEVIAQTFIFFLAGFETSSSIMSFCLYELANNREIQEIARQEIKQGLEKFDGELTYEGIMQLPYLDSVIYETMRKYPTLPHLTRICTKDYKLSGTDTVITKGTHIYIPVKGIHHDPQYYPDPETFDPDRFSKKNISKRHPFTFLPFGEGPRNCIGLRFGMLQTRLGIITTLMNYKIETSQKTSIPLKVDPNNLITVPLGGVWLNISRIC